MNFCFVCPPGPKTQDPNPKFRETAFLETDFPCWVKETRIKKKSANQNENQNQSKKKTRAPPGE